MLLLDNSNCNIAAVQVSVVVIQIGFFRKQSRSLQRNESCLKGRERGRVLIIKCNQHNT